MKPPGAGERKASVGARARARATDPGPTLGRLDRGPRRVDGAWDAVVVGAGFGGLAAALALAEGGARVLVCEASSYPGGCASTFERAGLRFEAGATLFSGLGPEQLFGRWIARHAIDVQVDWIDPLVELRAPHLQLRVERDREAFVRNLCALPGAPVQALRRFFDQQRRIADLTWELFGDPSLLPPLGPRAVLRHALRLPRLAPLAGTLLPALGRPLSSVLERFGLAEFEPLRLWLDATCQITLQERAGEVEALFGLAAMDYFWRGTGHVRDGIGVLAEGLACAIRRSGGEVALACGVKQLVRESGASRSTDLGPWKVVTRRGVASTRAVLTNVLPQSLTALVDGPLREGGVLAAEPALGARSRARLAAWGESVRGGWGACMLYRSVRTPTDASSSAQHLQLIADSSQSLLEGNHVFASIAGAADRGRSPAGTRTVTVSTHVPLAELLLLGESERAERVAAIQSRMRATLARRAPEWEAVESELPASPRTFERFTGRFGGFVGGLPRRAGWSAYRGLFDGPLERGLHLIGDSVFPGQSTLAVALGGVRAAERVLRGR